MLAGVVPSTKLGAISDKLALIEKHSSERKDEFLGVDSSVHRFEAVQTVGQWRVVLANELYKIECCAVVLILSQCTPVSPKYGRPNPRTRSELLFAIG